MPSKYEPLELHLMALPAATSELTLTFKQIDDILGAPLPRSAYVHREWWSNQTDVDARPQARAWTKARFAVDAVHQAPESGWVRFRRR